MKKYLAFILPVFLCHIPSGAQPVLKYCSDTASVLKELVRPDDSLVSQHEKTIEILNFNDLEKFLKPESRYKKIKIDFSRQYILCTQICPQCVASCPPDFQECHRNSCHYVRAWRLVERKGIRQPDLTFIGIKNVHHPDTLVITEEIAPNPLPDSIPEFIYLYRMVSDDCLALSRDQVYQDEIHKTVTWTVHHVYGGCAALRFEQVCIRIKNPGAGYHFVFDDTRE